MKLGFGPHLTEIRCCFDNDTTISTMIVKPSVSRAYDVNINNPPEMCASFFGPEWKYCPV